MANFKKNLIFLCAPLFLVFVTPTGAGGDDFGCKVALCMSVAAPVRPDACAKVVRKLNAMLRRGKLPPKCKLKDIDAKLLTGK
jgi:hypothetical protein